MVPNCPEPVYPPNTPLSQLRTAELFVVAAVRLWAAPHRDPDGAPHPDWREGFAAARLENDAAPDFDSLLQVVVAATQRPLDLRCIRCPHLGEDEAWLLQLVSLLQRNHAVAAQTILTQWLPPAAVRLAARFAAGFAATLRTAGLVVAPRPALSALGHRFRHDGREIGAGHRDCRLALLH